MQRLVDALLADPEPAVRWKVRSQILGQPVTDREPSQLVDQLLAPFESAQWPHVYAKWQGAHWVLTALAELGYPPGDERLHPLRDQVLDTWLDQRYHQAEAAAYGHGVVPLLDGRHRAHASQQGYALWALVKLGLDDGRGAGLAELLLRWQWPDGGWNCSRDPSAHTSSFCETLTPMRGLFAYGKSVAKRAARQAAEVFLSRRLAFRKSTGEIIRGEFTQLHYPLYWHYDILGGLKGMGELGLLADPRCNDALDRLESMRVEGGWPARARYYRAGDVDWGGTSKRRANPWVTADALAVLRAAGRAGE